MNRIFLGLGSNINRTENITAGLNELANIFDFLKLSPVYESEAVGFDGSCFFNLVVEVESKLPLLALSSCLKQIEDKNGRQRGGPHFSARTLDIDILTYGDLVGIHNGIELPRPELYYNGFVLRPLAELAPHIVDQKSGLSYSDLWSQHGGNIERKQKLWKAEFSWSPEVSSSGS